MRVLIGPQTDNLDELYAVPRTPWLRVNMVSSVDGAATGESGRTNSLNNEVDRAVFHHLRTTADAIVVGAGTARIEGYRPIDRPLVVVSRRAHVPESLREAPPGTVLLATRAEASGYAAARELLGRDWVVPLGEDHVDLARLRETLIERGWTSLLSEGGPHLLGDMLAAGIVDELCATVVPRLLSGIHPRMSAGVPVDVPLDLRCLLEADGTLLGRWFVDRPE